MQKNGLTPLYKFDKIAKMQRKRGKEEWEVSLVKESHLMMCC